MEDLLTCTEPNFWKSNREKTFKYWPYGDKDKCNKKEMAAAGFHAIGDSNEPDLVECFICGKQLDGWEPDDDPWLEHCKHQPSCEFVKLDKIDENTWTLEEYVNLLKENKKIAIKKRIKETVDTAKNIHQDILDDIQNSFKTNKH